MRNAFMYILPVLTPIFIGFAPAAVQVSFTAAAVASVITGWGLRNASIRRMLNLSPRVTAPPATRPAAPYKGSITVAGRARAYRAEAEGARAAAPPRGPLASVRNSIMEGKQAITDAVKSARPAASKANMTKEQRLAATRAEKYEDEQSKMIAMMRAEYEKEQEAKARGRRQ